MDQPRDISKSLPVNEGLPAEVTAMVHGYWANAQRAPKWWQKLGRVLYAFIILIGGMIDYLIGGEVHLPCSMEAGDYGR
ncbi:hypothetical protein A2215_00645 [Candidatus Berkelbacteria bacterium RIFOXYA2_FULL_43_10]|uniref:Uncharacterized protein n=1 Tax=Candidatus Berkelbacteria bacterium RIFOXYA2_FULL_43_10 TaxID=1797472 RepID=A0A1F5E9L9_9BACT|nr:MAG: hypothetical protein A2215_00645 [Candidatus Berkelbacteria bacterium RIFOXYA2_FULL_43_10]